MSRVKATTHAARIQDELDTKQLWVSMCSIDELRAECSGNCDTLSRGTLAKLAVAPLVGALKKAQAAVDGLDASGPGRDTVVFHRNKQLLVQEIQCK